MASKPTTVLTVVKAWHLTPHMIRVTLTGPEIMDMNPDCHGANCKIMLPATGQSRDAFVEQLHDGPKPIVRTYTVRQMRQADQEVDIDFVDHGDAGPASAWAQKAKFGDFCGFAGPGPLKVKSFYADRYLIAVDMSALPVAAATLEAMPEDAVGTAIFEILSDADRQEFRIPRGIDVHWVVDADARAQNVEIMEMVRSLDLSEGCTQTCIAGESTQIKVLRQELLVQRGLSKDDCYISGYWKVGLIEDEHQAMKRAEAAA